MSKNTSGLSGKNPDYRLGECLPIKKKRIIFCIDRQFTLLEATIFPALANYLEATGLFRPGRKKLY